MADSYPSVPLSLSVSVCLSVSLVHLTEELATSTARVAQLQLEATSHQQRASELQSKLAAALVDGEGHCVRISSLESQLEGWEPPDRT